MSELIVTTNGLRYFKTKLEADTTAKLSTKVDKESGKGLSSNDFTTTEKNKLAKIAENANNYSLPTASSSTLGGIKVGTNLTISNGVLSAVDTTYSNATQSTAGLMSSADKKKLDSFTLQVSSSAPSSGTPSTTITFVV